MARLPTRWYNIAADLPEPLPPMIDPLDDEGSRIARLVEILPSRLIELEYTLDKYIDIPGEVLDAYMKIGRPTPLARAKGFEKALGVGGGVKIFYKFEGVLPTGSHKINTAIPQAYYARLDGASEVVTETGAGQWGLAASTAASMFALKTTVFMTASSYRSKAGRRRLMEVLGATVYSSPSSVTENGRKALAEMGESHPGSLGLAIAEAVEYTLSSPDRRYLPGSVMEAVLILQTVIGLEVLSQLRDEPDYMIACVGGGSNFAGFTYPAIGAWLRGEGFEKTRFIAAESTASPKLTGGRYMYDGLDAGTVLPLAKMYSLGKDHVPPPLHSAGLRYHAAAPSLSLLRKLGIVEAVALGESEVLRHAMLFARSEGIIPAPESAHAIAAAAMVARREAGNGGVTIVFNLSGHGLLDVDAYTRFVEGGGDG
ncbi:TrpB-like pyridoxal phosphate-dependent enzyme [Aeropyrum camini]|uniref:tryptophan synthase n=1 Tax=Aeropyrum camini SY1 = JCM 12091 TaxID=1198449 RepID=U3TDR2_9CREN|nr:TrpB-like pyridoxal phosphate-dependent enzyme [Aeropyrum camini]BAN89499.1 pyridoxal-phosphate dependent TrpB-like enzyme [Aeropyrum camini SY1 = JCM 12091]